jgi:hypothetical protein
MSVTRGSGRRPTRRPRHRRTSPPARSGRGSSRPRGGRTTRGPHRPAPGPTAGGGGGAGPGSRPSAGPRRRESGRSGHRTPRRRTPRPRGPPRHRGGGPSRGRASWTQSGRAGRPGGAPTTGRPHGAGRPPHGARSRRRRRRSRGPRPATSRPAPAPRAWEQPTRDRRQRGPDTLELKQGSGDNDPVTESGSYPQAEDRLTGFRDGRCATSSTNETATYSTNGRR